jgi:hypothetical protein
MSSLKRQVFVVAAVVLVLLIWNRTARAQSSTIMVSTLITRSNSSHPNDTTTQNEISRADCLNDDVMTIPLVVSYSQSFDFQVWVGNATDCTQLVNRTTTPTCGRVLENAALGTTTPSISLPVRDILHALANPGQNAQGAGTIADCDASVQTNTLPQTLDIWFMFLNGSTVDSSQDLQTKFALLGPASPTGISVGSGDTLLKVTWDAEAAGTVSGYYFFCSPKPGHEVSNGGGANVVDSGGGTGGAGGAAGAGGDDSGGDAAACDSSDDSSDVDACTAGTGGADTSGAGGSTGTGGGSSGCDLTGTLVEGSIPTQALFDNNQCGQATGSLANTGLVTGLVNGANYAVSVAAYDSLGNTGALSGSQCGTPQKVNDFNTVYRAAGGTAGGSSFCSLSGVGRAGGSGAPFAVGFGAALGLLRMRGSKSRSNRGKKKAIDNLSNYLTI